MEKTLNLRSRKNESAGKTKKKSPDFEADEESEVPMLNRNGAKMKNGIDHDFLKPSEIRRPFFWLHWTLFFVFIASMYSFVIWCDSRLPEAVTLDEAKPGQFVEERARNFLIELTSFGPRPSGK